MRLTSRNWTGLGRAAACVAAIVGLSGVVVAAAAGRPARGRYQPVTFNIPAQLPNASTGEAYSYAFSDDVSGGTGPPYDFNFKGGARPPAQIHLNPSTGGLSGKVTAKPGTYGFTVCATGRRRPVGGSAPGNTACDSTKILVVRGTEPNPVPKPNPSFTLSANPPGVNLDIDGSRQTTVISVNGSGGFNRKVTFSTVGSPPTGLSISFLDPPAGTQGTTLSLAAAQDAKEGNYQLTILGTSGSLTAQTVVIVTINEPDFSGTYTGTWSGSFASSAGDGCVMSEGGRVTVQVVKQLPAGYNATFTFAATLQQWNPATCSITATVDEQFAEGASYSNGNVVGTTFTISGRSLSGRRVDTYPGGTETISFMAQR